MFVKEHYSSQPGLLSAFLPPAAIQTDFDLELLWSQPTFNNPVQFWRVSSVRSLTDYTGVYKLKLLACVASAGQLYQSSAHQQKCAAEEVVELPLQIAFQQSSRPIPAVYSLATQFQLTNSEQLFLSDQTNAAISSTGEEFHGQVSR